ncbi:MAG: F0F1 ATP synthase subunit A [Phototrophicaceae bacterium]
MELSPDNIVYWESGFVTINATLVFSWVVMAILVIGSFLITRNLSTDTRMSRWQNALETIIVFIQDQIRDITQSNPRPLLSFIATLFLFIGLANLLSVVPGYEPPTGSLSTTIALALCVFVAVPIYGIAQQGVLGYLRNYIEPTVIMLPFNIISEVSRTVALAIRLFGNIMSGRILVAIMLSIIPLFIPTVLQVLDLIIGLIQAYIFAILATVYIGSGTRQMSEDDDPGEAQREADSKQAQA